MSSDEPLWVRLLEKLLLGMMGTGFVAGFALAILLLATAPLILGAVVGWIALAIIVGHVLHKHFDL